MSIQNEPIFGIYAKNRVVQAVNPILTCKKNFFYFIFYKKYFFSSGYHFVKKKSCGQHKFHLVIHQPKLKKNKKKNYFLN
jgi:hypothetical protein